MAFLHKYLPILALKHVLYMIKRSRFKKASYILQHVKIADVQCAMRRLLGLKWASACRKILLLTLVILWPKSIFVKMSEIIFEPITSEVLTINTGTLGACYV